MANILIAFYSRDGAVEALAEAVAQGAMSAGGAVRMRRARELVSADVIARVPGWGERIEAMNARHEPPSEEDAKWADAIIFGTPTRFGMIASELKAYIDSLGGLWARGRLNLKVGSAFCSTANTHGGNEITNFSLFAPMAHLGMVIVPPGYADPAMQRAGTPYGASWVAGPRNAAPDEQACDAARFQGQRVAQVADALAVLRAG